VGNGTGQGYNAEILCPFARPDLRIGIRHSYLAFPLNSSHFADHRNQHLKHF